MKKRSLVTKVLVTFTIVIGSITTILALLVSIWFKNYCFDTKKQQLDKESEIIVNSAISHRNAYKYDDDIGLNNIIKFVATTIEADILLADNLGYVYMVSSGIYEDLKYTKVKISDETLTLLKDGQSYDLKDIEDNSISAYAYLKPVIYNNDYYGTIIMLMPKKIINDNLIKGLSAIWIASIIIILINSIIVYFFIKIIILKPLTEINLAANRLAKGDVERRVAISSADEIGDLAESFNIMAESLEKSDKNRKEFISNVSHELRSPITSIKGFIAAILDGVVPKDKETYYLNIVHDEIRRLSRLVNDLLDISTMEAGKFKLNIEEFDINAILKLCLVNNEGKVSNKNMKVEFVYQNDREFILGDRDRIIQVITNLIDNAIKYGARDGIIEIKSISKGNKVYISIFNDGPSLTKEQMIKIWDRFYMVDKSRTKKVSTGLGLSIVRLILTQHGEDIWVESEEKKGVTFTFSLTKA